MIRFFHNIIFFGLALFLNLLFASQVFASVVDFIVDNNPDVLIIRRLENNIFKNLTVKLSGDINQGSRGLDYSVMLSADLPLLSPSEISDFRLKYSSMVRKIRLEVAELVRLYISELKFTESETLTLNTLYAELQWLAKRVQEGVDSQKEYNQKLDVYLTRRALLEQRRAQLPSILDKILSYVPVNKRDNVKEQLIKYKD